MGESEQEPDHPIRWQEPGEYFAESLVAYLAEHEALMGHDAIGVRIVEQAIALMQQ